MSDKIIVNEWQDSAQGVRVSRIIERHVGCEGIDVRRYQADGRSVLDLAEDYGHIISMLAGSATLGSGSDNSELCISGGTHAYIPPGYAGSVRFTGRASVIHACAPGDRALGTQLLVHNERYLAPTRFVLTPQYLSRRAFLHRDHTLVSGNGDRIAWFHTTMFDTQGLPPNHDGKPVFKMSYDNQSEVNVVHEVKGDAAVRFAGHPYVEPHEQSWSAWHSLDGDTTYYLNEGADRPGRRNRHEIYIAPGGHVSLCCMFDPGPTGLETHQPGEYSSYAPVADIVDTKAYRDFLTSMAAADDMVRTLSLAQAQNGGEPDRSSQKWTEYQSSLERALESEEQLIRGAAEERRNIMTFWRIRNF